MKFVFALIVSLILAHLSQNNASRFGAFEFGKTKKLDAAYVILLIYLCLFVGLRYKYNDTSTYMGSYTYDAVYLSDFFRSVRLSFGANPGFHFCNSIMKTLGFDAHLFIMTYACFAVISFMRFIRKYSEDFMVSVYFYFIICILFAMAAIKQTTATAIGIYAIEAALNKRWRAYLLIMFVAMLFHPYIILFSCIPFVLGKEVWSRTTFVLVAVFLVLGLFFSAFSSLLSAGASFMGDEFSVEDLTYGRGVNTLRFLVFFACFILFFIFKREIYGDAGEAPKLFFHLHLIAGCFMFMALFGNQILIGRIPQYFSMGTCVNIVYAVSKIEKKSSLKIYKYLMIICYALYVSYEILYLKPFDKRYQAISTRQFAHSVVKIFTGTGE